jgi:F0F1-type ATP synthase assembly protein I
MSNRFSLEKSGEGLSVGNVVSAGLRIYRDNFKLYYSLALQAYLWVLIPIYGWAKFAMISGLISRLAFSQVNERPETETSAKNIVNPRLWSFFVTGLLVGLILFGVMFGGIIAGTIIFTIVGIIFGQSTEGIIVLTSLAIIAIFGFIYYFVWFYSRLAIAELPVAIEENDSPNRAISRSWDLTKGNVWRLQSIFFVAFLILLPISIVIQIAQWIFQILFAFLISPDSSLGIFIFFLFNLALILGSGALTVPFWQSIKAVLYYDLRARREGMNLQMRDS